MIRLYEILPGEEAFAEDPPSTAKPSSFTHSPPAVKNTAVFSSQSISFTTTVTYHDQSTEKKKPDENILYNTSLKHLLNLTLLK